MTQKQNPNPAAASKAIRAALRDFSEQDAVRLLFAEVAEYGKEHFEQQYRATAKRPELIGLELAQVFSASEVAEVAYAAWEDMNAHDANRWLAWYWPELCSTKYDNDLGTLQRTINKQPNRDIWSYDGNDWKITRYALKVTAEKQEATQ